MATAGVLSCVWIGSMTTLGLTTRVRAMVAGVSSSGVVGDYEFGGFGD